MGRNKQQTGYGLIDKIFLCSLGLVFLGVFFHAPFIVVVGSLWPDGALYIKAWKEIIMFVALAGAIFILWRENKWDILRNWLGWLIGIYILWGLIIATLIKINNQALVAGLMIDYRYILAFSLFYIAGNLYPQWRKWLIRLSLVGFAAIVIFGLLQVFVLPHDALKYIGYDKQTNIAPYLTVDENYDFIRINSTLRGPNVLGAMMVMSVAGITSYMLVFRKKLLKDKRKLWWLVAFLIGSLICLWASYSRSALGAAAIAALLAVVVYYRNKITKTHIIGFLVGFLIVFTGMFLLKDNHFISTVILHEDPNEAGLVNSNDGHVESLIEGMDLMSRQPIGAGIGSTGSASLMTEKPIIIENQYLFIAHELGWLGVAIFLAISFGILWLLWGVWIKNGDWLALAVLTSGVGLMIIGLVLPVWVDDTVSIVWWGLAGFLIGQHKIVNRKRGQRA